MTLSLIIAYIVVSYAVGYHLFMTGGSDWRTWTTWVAWALSPVIVIPAIILLFIAG